jgi:hypothetical protein
MPTKFCALIVGLFSLLSSSLTAANLKVNLAPSAAVSAGAQWQVDSGAWKNSGVTVKNLSNGSHTVTFKTVSGWIAPAPLPVTLSGGNTTLSATYVRPASLTMNLTPSSAQWRVDGSGWNASGATATGLAPGDHTIEYLALPGYSGPATETVSLAAGQTSALSRSYTPLASFSVVLEPANGQWRLDGGGWNASGAVLANLATGSHSVDYSTVPGYVAPPAESVNLVGGSNPTLTRTYTSQTGNLTILLTPTDGQWRVDAGAWQASGSTVTGLTVGTHAVDYIELHSYQRPVTETVTILPESTSVLSRAYTALVELGISVSPASAVRVGAVSWRVDGGGWLAPEAKVTLPVGSHMVEFLESAGWIVPSPTEVILSDSQPATIGAQYHPVHRLRFFLNENLIGSLSSTELQMRIGQYAAHVQEIFHRETVRRFTFDPATDITICTASPFSNSYTGTLPQIGYEIWAYAQLTDNPTLGSYDGYGALDQSGAGGAGGLKWDMIHDAASLQADTPQLRQYWTQIDHIVHEIEHVFGAGIGEYYSPKILTDPTTVAPILATTSFVQPDPEDHFWGSRGEYWTDPLTVNIYDHWRAGSPKSLPDLLGLVSFAPATKVVIADLRRSDYIPTIPNLTQVRVSVVDATSGQPIPGSTLRVWNRRNYDSNFEHIVSATATPGTFTFTWAPYPHVSVFGNYDNMKILKAWAPGYTAKALWEWIYDAQKARLVDGVTEFQITVSLQPE